MTPDPTTRLELMAPAGSMESLRAAVANGADAVYFGLEDFNARRRAENFTLACLQETVRYLHGRNVRGYVAFNTLVFSEELSRAAAFVAGIAEAGVDAVIVQDIGLMRLIRRMCPTLPIHASTQATQTHAAGIEYLRSLGVSRVILARELSLDDIGRIHRDTPAELEVFVHGALCISFSGQCLASESLFGRSANRGVCAQACRLPYHLVVDGQAAVGPAPAYVLSPKDLCACDRIPQLIQAGVTAFKIEGRLKSPHYVAAATRLYRQAVDAATKGIPFAPTDQHMEDLAQSFSRGFTHGFLDGHRHRELVDGRSPKARGLAVGTVVGRTGQGVLVDLDEETAPTGEPLKPGDGVVFDDRQPEGEEQGGRVYTVRAAGAGRSAWSKTGDASKVRRVEITFGRSDVDLAAVARGSTVWKTDDPAVRRRLEGSYRRDNLTRRVALTITVRIEADRRLRVSVRDDDGHEIAVACKHALEPAKRHPMTADLLRDQFGRLGDTPFKLGGVSLLGPSGPTDALPFLAPKSVLNELRRRAVQAILEQRLATDRHAVAEVEALAALRAEAFARPAEPRSGEKPWLCVLVRSKEQLGAVLEWDREHTSVLEAVYREVEWPDRDAPDAYQPGTQGASPIASKRPDGFAEGGEAHHRPLIGFATPVICKPGEESTLAKILEQRPEIILVRNLAALTWLRKHAQGIPLVGDHGLNVTNELSAAFLMEGGLSRLTPGYDLDSAQLAALLKASPGVSFELITHSHVPMFHTAHCLLAARLGGGNDCGDCALICRKHRLKLKDRIGVEHPVLFDAHGRNTVFNGQARSAAELFRKMAGLGVQYRRIELLTESARETRDILTRQLEKPEARKGWDARGRSPPSA